MFKKNSKPIYILAQIIFLCIIFILITIFLIFNGYNNSDAWKNIRLFIIKNNIFKIYLILINLITFIVYGIDKNKALKNKRRISIATLITLAFAGGGVGGYSGMYFFRHKTKKIYFYIGIPFIILTHLTVILLLVFV